MNFELINNLTKEYVLIVEALRKKYGDRIIDNEKRIYLDRELFEELLAKKDFLSVYEKKKIWRSLGWISCDNDESRFTKIIKINKNVFRKIVIETEPQKTLKNLINTQ